MFANQDSGEKSSKDLKIGFRHVKLIQEPIKDSPGKKISKGKWQKVAEWKGDR